MKRVLRFPLAVAKQPIMWLAFLFLWTLVRLIRNRSLETRLRVIRMMVRVVYVLAKGPRRRIKRNLSLIRPDLDSKTIDRGAWQVAETIARSWAAMLGDNGRTPEQLKERLEVEGMETLLAYQRGGERVIVAVGHVGPVDDMFGVFSLYDLRVYIPVEPVKPKWLFNMMTKYRKDFGDVVLEPVERGRTLERARVMLQKGRIVVLTIDVTQNDPTRGVKCQIGKGEARFPVGAAKLGLAEHATIVPVFLSLSENGKSKIVVGEPIALERTGNPNLDIEINTRRLIKDYAPHIQKHWDSWLRALWANLEPVSDKRQETSNK